MSRWHKLSCSKPIIRVDDGDTPRCTSCGCRCPWQELVASSRSSDPLLNIPETPSGQMNLRWPPSVPYKSMLETSNPDLSQTTQEAMAVKKVEYQMTKPQLPHLPVASSSNQTASNKAVDSPIYGDTLAPDEFRLACLTAAEDDEQFPLHVSLEVFKDDNCPEYETVSYTWGGEDGDYSRSRPIFVGPFWDVVFQTKNCWDMLRFVRPWRGTRIVWVDALCINQGNITERGQQVAKMGQIYEQCLRVIVYLGSDLVLSLPRGEFPSRCRLSELENGSIRPRLPANHKLGDTPLNLREILRRQYFGRVWVIQELLLSQRTVMRIGDVDFWTDSAPWPAIPAEGSLDVALQWDLTQAPWVQYIAQKAFPLTNVLDVLRITSSSQASDPRDRIFGLLSLIHLDDVGEGGWQPDYSLSPQHVFTGLFAHCIANLGRCDFLLFAAGLTAPSSTPSWVPADWSTQESWQRLFAEVQPHFDTEATTRVRGVHGGPVRSLPLGYWMQPLNGQWVNRGALDRPWNKDIAICTATGALSLNLTHFCSVPAQPARVEQLSTTTIFKVSGRNRGLYLVSEHSLDTIVIPGRDHIFILVSETSVPLYFILRETESHGSFRLVAPCTYLFIYPALKLGSLHHRISNAREMMESSIYLLFTQWGMNLLFPGADKGWDVLPDAELGNAATGSTPTFESAYLSCINKRFRPCVKDGYIELTLPVGEITSYHSDEVYVSVCGAPQAPCRVVKVGWEWRRWGTWTPFTDKPPELVPVLAKGGLKIRAPLNAVRSCCDIWFENVAAVQRVLGVNYDELDAVLRQGPEDRHHFIACPSLQELIAMEDFGLDIYTDKVLVL
ncbi:heterokaryon incompatibility protein-domain-containing protein [Diplogelasinospora grovesii]|uniref:Heterokaryon incompatibility protein-domain-containing protein n=1 Tax=Diplogelasinospora grovesii TaxID=303347 RepID=A0AAN6NBX4_9PEZI|nr:heterokaryon incompatibility protein-domain-containing protein [Diplogelasinospora grovesii]